MNPIVLFSVCLVLATFSACSGRPADSQVTGKYTVSKTNYDDGKYRPVKRNEGRYIHMVQPYVHIHDNRELGQYVHIPNPYDGGYGPYSGMHNPYRHDESGNYDKYTTTSTTTRRTTTTTTTTAKPRLFNYFEEGGWKILRQEEEKKKHKYDFLYHTENGIYGEEKANLHPGNGTAASGYYEYTGDDGELYRVNYKSDHRGFVPEGDHIPTPPPVPDAIKRALEYVAKKQETHGQVQSGRYEHRTDPVRLQNMPTIDRPLVPQLPRPVPTLPSPFLQQQQQPRALSPLPSPLIQQQPQKPRPFPTLPPLPPLPTLAPIAAQPRFVQYSENNQYTPLPTIAPQNAPLKAYQAPSLASKRPADQLIQQTQLAQQSEPDQLPHVQVLLPQVQADKPAPVVVVEDANPVQVPELSSPVKLPDPVQALKPIQPPPLPKIEPQPLIEEEQLQADQPQADQPQSDEPQADQPLQSVPELLVKEEIPTKPDEQPENIKTEQSIESIVIVKPDDSETEVEIEPESKNQEVSPEASEKEDKIEPSYQVPEQLKDEDNFELTMA